MIDKPQLVRKGSGDDYDYSMDHCFVKVASSDMDGKLSMVEDEIKPGFKLERHHHRIMVEVFYVLEGEIEFTFDDRVVTLSAGDTLTIPPHVRHAAESKEGGRMLTIFIDGQFDAYLKRLSGMTDQQFQDASLMKSVGEQYDIYAN